MPTHNNSRFGFTVQKVICDIFKIIPESDYARKLFETNYDNAIASHLFPIIIKAFKDLGHNPIKCHTLEKLGTYVTPFNFTLDDGSTLSIRTNMDSDKVSPRNIGQAGFEKLNDQFGEIYGKEIQNQDDIKHLFIDSVDRVLPVFIDNLFDADHIMWIRQIGSSIIYDFIDGNTTLSIDFVRDKFTFTRNFDEWIESTTLKYKGVSIAEIQIHKNRTFKFRFIMNNLLPLLIARQINTETLGITAELVICGEFDLDYPSKFKERYSATLSIGLRPTIRAAFEQLPRPIKYTGKDSGSRGGASKCSYDFLLEGNKTLSLKTNTGKMVCPPEVGQPSAETCKIYFGQFLLDPDMNETSFKEMVYDHIADMMPIYVSHLFDSDYLLRIKESPQDHNTYSFTIARKDTGSNFEWNISEFSFSKPSIDEWIESNSVRYKGISIGEFQVHQHRNSFKFRFNYDNLLKLLNNI